MEPELIDKLRGYRTGLAAQIAAPSFACRADRAKVLAAMLATDRLLSAVVELLPPVGLDDCATAQELR